MGIHVFPSRLGWMALTYSPRGVTRLVFGHPSAQAARSALGPSGKFDQGEKLPGWIAQLVQALVAYAEGRRVRLPAVPLDWTGLTPFQRRVLEACRAIPRGKTLTYRQLAEAAGSPGAARAVGQCMAKNRFPLIIPCHRVVGSDGRLVGFSAPQGRTMKRRLLQMEAGTLRWEQVKPKVRGLREPARRRSAAGPAPDGGT